MVNISIRRIIENRAGGRCEYCASPANHTPDDFAAEHIVPVVLGGTSDLDNLAWSCQGCNQRKFTAVSGTDPLTARKVRRFHPRRSRWEQHWEWSEDTLRIIR